MKYEKSCGAVIYRGINNREYLLIENKKPSTKHSHWGFPKGHMENGETEQETALREIYEETGLSVKLIADQRLICRYNPSPDTTKDVVYFLAEATSKNIALQENEICDYCWLSYNDALKRLTYDSDRQILKSFIKIPFN